MFRGINSAAFSFRVYLRFFLQFIKVKQYFRMYFKICWKLILESIGKVHLDFHCTLYRRANISIHA